MNPLKIRKDLDYNILHMDYRIDDILTCKEIFSTDNVVFDEGTKFKIVDIAYLNLDKVWAKNIESGRYKSEVLYANTITIEKKYFKFFSCQRVDRLRKLRKLNK